MTLAKDFEDFVQLLNKYKVDYMVVGGYALALHGKPRHTGDLDIWINNSEDNAEKMIHVLNDFGMATLGFTKNDFLKTGYVTQIGYPPLRIDILNNIDGIEFNVARANRQTVKLDELEVFFIGLHDFLRNKKASGRSQDLADIQEIKKIISKTPGKRKRT